MTLSKRQLALTELQTRLQNITVAKGYQTDAGDLIFIGEAPALGESDPTEALAIVIQPDEPGFQGEKVVIRLPVEVWAIAKTTEPWGTVEAVVADIKTAIETDRDLAGTLLPRGLERGVTQALQREDGQQYVGASVAYRLVYAEEWGAP